MVLEKSSDRGKDIEIKMMKKGKKDYRRQLFERLHLDSATHRSSQKFGAEKTDHSVEARKEVPSLPDNQRHQALLSRKNERIPARVIKSGKQGETYAWKPLSLEEMRKSDAVFLPQCVTGYDRPLYYEQLKETGNFDAKATMAAVRLMETKAGEQYVVKRAGVGKGYDNLLRQVRRMQEMRAEGITIIPQLVDVTMKERELYYVMPYIKSGAADEVLFENMTDEEFLGKLNSMLSHFDQELWSKGDYSSEQHYFSQRHLFALERSLEDNRNVLSEEMPTLLEKEKFTVNGEQVTNLPVLLSWIKQSSPALDSVFATAKVPHFTHGDLHFGNILFDEAGKPYLIDFSGSKAKSVVEFEASRILASCYRYIVMNKECSIMQGESGDLRLQYTERGQEILQRRQQALDAIMEHPAMQNWFTHKEQSRHMIELLEAIFLAAATRQHPRLVPYVLGTQLLEQTIRKSGFCDTAILEHEKQDRLWKPLKRDVRVRNPKKLKEMQQSLDVLLESAKDETKSIKAHKYIEELKNESSRYGIERFDISADVDGHVRRIREMKQNLNNPAFSRSLKQAFREKKPNEQTSKLRSAANFYQEMIRPLLATRKDAFSPRAEYIDNLCNKLVSNEGANIVLYYSLAKVQSSSRTDSPDTVIDMAEIEMLRQYSVMARVAQKSELNLRFTIVNEIDGIAPDSVLGYDGKDNVINLEIAKLVIEGFGAKELVSIRSLKESITGPLAEEFNQLYEKKRYENLGKTWDSVKNNTSDPLKIRVVTFLDSMPDKNLEQFGITSPEEIKQVRAMTNSNDLNGLPSKLLENLVEDVAHLAAIMDLRPEAEKKVQSDNKIDEYPEYDPNRVVAGISMKSNRLSFKPSLKRFEGRTVNPLHGLAVYTESSPGKQYEYAGIAQYRSLQSRENIEIVRLNGKPIFAVQHASNEIGASKQSE